MLTAEPGALIPLERKYGADLCSSQRWGPVMGRSIKNTGLVAGMLILVGGCQNIGPMSIDAGRDHYNSALQSTAKVQTLSNIIRVYAHDSTSFTDVSEIAATTTASGTGGGTLSGIGSKPGTFALLGSVTGSVTYSEAPLVRFVPLTGSGLVSQMVKPLTPDAIESLITSNWQTIAVLDLAVLSITPDQRSSFAALNIISSLANDASVMLVAGKSDLTSAAPPVPGRTAGADPNGSASRVPANDTLMIYRRSPNPVSARTQNYKQALRLWAALEDIYKGSQKDSANPIELRAAPVLAKMLKPPITTGVPLLKTYSGLGILKNATEQPVPKIRFLDRALYETIRRQPWNDKAKDVGFYMLLPNEEDENDNPKYKQMGNINSEIEEWIEDYAADKDQDRLMLYKPKSGLLSIADPDFVNKNRRLGTLRRYLLVIKDDVAPESAYVAYRYQGKWYYIAADDPVSQMNFNLVSLLLTVMSVPSTLPPITTSISTGGG